MLTALFQDHWELRVRFLWKAAGLMQAETWTSLYG